ncbi:hypothetical protein [Kutzneria sp. NPDC052558]|uniref:hypothetical protein n=1 Tax=Kutzneria sp. NPDC052558 TaxID=3364121 RepID=UPI0037C6F97F
MDRIRDLAALDTWLDERDGFEDGLLLDAARSDSGAVTLRLEQTVHLGLRPGDVEVVEVHELVADAPFAFEPPTARLGPAVSASPRYGRMAIEIDGSVVLVANEFTVRHVDTVHRRTEPYTGDELTVASPDARDGRFWSRHVGELLGAPVVWRLIGGPEPRAVDQDIDGCFLQARDRLATTDHGVFCMLHRDGSVTMRREHDADIALWQAVRMTAGRFDRIRSGNCVFTSADWNAYLATGVFPPDERLRLACSGGDQ